jgi:hypothetical protein
MEDVKEFSPSDSLKLITSMIQQTKESVVDNSFYFLFWGWLSFVACIGEFLLATGFHYKHHYIVWFLMPIGGIITGIYQSRMKKKEQIRTVLSDSIGHLWSGIGLLFFAIFFINMKIGWDFAFVQYILLYATGTFITGRMMKFTPLVIGGLSNFVIAFFATDYNMVYQSLFAGIALLLSYIIPGHMLQAQFKKRN